MDKDSVSFSFASMLRPTIAYTIPPWVVIVLFINLKEFISSGTHLYFKFVMLFILGVFVAYLFIGTLNTLATLIGRVFRENIDVHLVYKGAGTLMVSIGLLMLSLEKSQIENMDFAEPVTFSLIALGFMYMRLKID